jgi:peptidoglycan/xylan/chitin deacetylase (PgdA/CDA1 family)
VSLLVLMYHRAREGRHGNSAAMLDAHFAYLASRCANVLPGETLAPDKPSVCVSFDDGYFDFYTTVFPLLRRHNLRALLAIPPYVIRETVAVKTADRLGFDSDDAFTHPSRGGFCTWSELAEMTASGSVQIAAHGFTHTRLDDPQVDLEAEIEAPRAVLSARLDQAVDSFVFPYGRYSPRSLTKARLRYRHVFRIGGALNRSWDSRLMYRIDADGMKAPGALLAPARMAAYRVRYLWNQLRRR